MYLYLYIIDIYVFLEIRMIFCQIFKSKFAFFIDKE